MASTQPASHHRKQKAAAETPARGFGRFARLTGRGYSPLLEPLIRTLKVRHPKDDITPIIRAFNVANYHHREQYRKSGDPYITHPVAVATILAELGLTGETLIAALLHDTVEDTDYTLEQLTKDFGPDVALLVDGVTKLDRVEFGSAAEAETVRKMIIAMAKDVRVLMIKLADRLHNARTWRYVTPESSARKAKETLEIYAALAHRLGLNTIKWELEDLSFAALWPKVYAEIVRLVGERTPQRQKIVANLTEQVEKELRSVKIRATVTGRSKHYYSIYQKMQEQDKEFNEIYDLLGIRVLVDSVRDCYAVLGALHARWSPIPGRFKDYIAMPKFNMYQSLHTTVIGPGGKRVEIQIRTHEMHHRAEYGVAAHWIYKRGGSAEAETPGRLRAGPVGRGGGFHRRFGLDVISLLVPLLFTVDGGQGGGIQGIGLAVENDTAGAQADDTIGKLLGQGDVVNIDNGCQMAFGTQFTDQAHDLARGLGVEAGGGFVDQQQTRALNQGPGDADPLALATGEGVGALVDGMRQPDPLQQAEGLGHVVSGVAAHKAAPEADIA